MAQVSRMFLVLWLPSLSCGDVLTDISRTSLTKIHWPDVPSDTTHLLAADNFISQVSFVPFIFVLEEVDFSRNELKALPDFRNVADSLTTLRLDYNPIVSIHPPDLLADLSSLRLLSMEGTSLTALPEIQYFPPALEDLLVPFTQLESLPNFCLSSVARAGAFLVKNTANPYKCNRKMIWAKLASDSSPDLGLQFTCSTPSDLAGLSIEQFTVKELLGRPESTRQYARLTNPTEFFCYPHITSVTPETSKISCAASCSKNLACLLFAVDDGGCVLTEYTPDSLGPPEPLMLYTDWWIEEL